MILNNQITIKLLGLAWYQLGYFASYPIPIYLIIILMILGYYAQRLFFKLTASRITYFRGQVSYV
jgi:hypothetical protein